MLVTKQYIPMQYLAQIWKTDDVIGRNTAESFFIDYLTMTRPTIWLTIILHVPGAPGVKYMSLQY